MKESTILRRYLESLVVKDYKKIMATLKQKFPSYKVRYYISHAAVIPEEFKKEVEKLCKKKIFKKKNNEYAPIRRQKNIY